jgi:glucokinase
VERVLSGAGLVAIYEYAADALAPADPEVRAEMKGTDPAAVVSRSAMDGRCEACRTALDLFVALYGAEAGNLALRSLATGGVYVGGGIAPRILPRLRDGAFLRAFLDKGRFSSFLARVPLRVILTERAPLLGAAAFALRVP